MTATVSNSHVTRILGPFCDFSMIPEHVLVYATERGRLVHDACAALAHGLWIPKDLQEDCLGYIESFKKWKQHVERFVLIEQGFIHPTLGYHMRPDFVVIMKGDHGLLSLWDLKTPVQLRMTWKAQLAAYKAGLEAHNYKIARLGSVQLKANGAPPRVIEYEDSKRDFAAFMAAMTAFEYFKEG